MISNSIPAFPRGVLSATEADILQTLNALAVRGVVRDRGPGA